VSSPGRTSPFVSDALAAFASGRAVVLDGAVDDDVLLHGATVTVTRALAQEWAVVSDALVARWTPAEGLTPLDPAHRDRLRHALVGAQPAPGPGEPPLDDPLERRDPLDVAMMLVELFAQDRRRVLVIIEHAELVCTAGADPYSRRVTAALLHAVETFEAASELHALALLARDLGAVDASIVQRAGMARLRLAAHTVDDRAEVAAQAFGEPADGPRIERLAIATDGLALREIAMLPAHAQATRTSLEQPRELTASFRHGHRVDPWATLTRERMQEIRRELRGHVFAQDRAVGEVLDRLDVARSGLELTPPSGGARKSRLELFLVGMTGVGKNELARGLASAIFGDPSAVLIFDMSTLQQEHSGERLFGAPPGYVGHERGSPIVNRLRERPFTVIVFDEIEKAHPNNWLRLMGVVDEGRVTDSRHVEASLEDAIVIFTSNIGGDVLLERAAAGPIGVEEVEAMTVGLVEAHMSRTRYEVPSGETRAGLGKPEVWGRMAGSVIAFDLLREEAVERIVGRFCATLESSARRVWRIAVEIDCASVAQVIARRLGPPGSWNGRLIKDHVDRLLRRPLARAYAENRFAGARQVTVALDEPGVLRLALS
jgi:hypothetical protein